MNIGVGGEVAVAPYVSLLMGAGTDLSAVKSGTLSQDPMAYFGSSPVAVKPPGLTGGKGVKVMGPHLASHEDARRYALEVLGRCRPGEGVHIEEKIVGAEFTIQAISDGRTVLFPPATYDYPFRFDGDEGPGTGGMGSLSMPTPTLPFMTAHHYRTACTIIERVIARLADEGRHFTGVMNSGFFATADGVKVIEFNARFGDPECMNIMSLLESSWSAVMEQIVAGRLAAGDVALSEEASLVLYLVSPDYALRSGPAYDFSLDPRALEGQGCQVHFSSAVETGPNAYRTVGTSRALALATTAPTLEQARVRIVECAATVPVLEWRADVGQEAYLSGLGALVRRRPDAAAVPLQPNAL